MPIEMHLSEPEDTGNRVGTEADDHEMLSVPVIGRVLSVRSDNGYLWRVVIGDTTWELPSHDCAVALIESAHELATNPQVRAEIHDSIEQGITRLREANEDPLARELYREIGHECFKYMSCTAETFPHAALGFEHSLRNQPYMDTIRDKARELLDAIDELPELVAGSRNLPELRAQLRTFVIDRTYSDANKGLQRKRRLKLLLELARRRSANVPIGMDPTEQHGLLNNITCEVVNALISDARWLGLDADQASDKQRGQAVERLKVAVMNGSDAETIVLHLLCAMGLSARTAGKWLRDRSK